MLGRTKAKRQHRDAGVCPVLSGVKWGRISRSARPAGAGRARGPAGAPRHPPPGCRWPRSGRAAVAISLWCGARARSIQRDQKCRDGAAPSTTRIASRIQAALNSRVTRAMSRSNACCSGRRPVARAGGERQGRHGQQGDQRREADPARDAVLGLAGFDFAVGFEDGGFHGAFPLTLLLWNST